MIVVLFFVCVFLRFSFAWFCFMFACVLCLFLGACGEYSWRIKLLISAEVVQEKNSKTNATTKQIPLRCFRIFMCLCFVFLLCHTDFFLMVMYSCHMLPLLFPLKKEGLTWGDPTPEAFAIFSQFTQGLRVQFLGSTMRFTPVTMHTFYRGRRCTPVTGRLKSGPMSRMTAKPRTCAVRCVLKQLGRVGRFFACCILLCCALCPTTVLHKLAVFVV